MAEIDPKFDEYRTKWAGRLGMTVSDAAHGFMRGEAMALKPSGKFDLPPGKTGITLRVDGRGVDAMVDPGAIDDMLSQWRLFLLMSPLENEREYTKGFIIHSVASNRHTDAEYGPMTLCGVLWLASDNATAMTLLREGNHVLQCEMSFNDESQELRMQMNILS